MGIVSQSDSSRTCCNEGYCILRYIYSHKIDDLLPGANRDTVSSMATSNTHLYASTYCIILCN